MKEKKDTVKTKGRFFKKQKTPSKVETAASKQGGDGSQKNSKANRYGKNRKRARKGGSDVKQNAKKAKKVEEASEPKEWNFDKIKVAIVPIYWDVAERKDEKQAIIQRAEEVSSLLKTGGIETAVDTRRLKPGEKMGYWERRGVKVRIELGPDEVKNGKCRLAVKIEGADLAEKFTVPVGPKLIQRTKRALKSLGVDLPPVPKIKHNKLENQDIKLEVKSEDLSECGEELEELESSEELEELEESEELEELDDSDDQNDLDDLDNQNDLDDLKMDVSVDKGRFVSGDDLGDFELEESGVGKWKGFRKEDKSRKNRARGVEDFSLESSGFPMSQRKQKSAAPSQKVVKL